MEEKIENVLLICLDNIIKYSKRSNKRIIPLHTFLGNNISKNIKYEVKLKGLFNDKNVDLYSDYIKTAYEVKLIVCNYKQNSNNYFENMIGATINLKQNGYRVVQLVFIPKYLPHFNKEGILKSIEYISDRDIQKYEKLMRKRNYCPDNLLLCVFDTGNEEYLKNNIDNKLNNNELYESYNISIVSKFNKDIQTFMDEYGNIEKFILNERRLNESV